MERFGIVVMVFSQETKIRVKGIMSSKGLDNVEIDERQKEVAEFHVPTCAGGKG